MSNNRKKWSEFEEIFKQSDSNQAVSVLKNRYKFNELSEFKNKYGKGLLHLSVELNKPKIAEYLMSNEYFSNQINRQDGRTPLALALSLPRSSENLITLLCEKLSRNNHNFSWEYITDDSKTLKFGNEAIARVFRFHVIRLANKAIFNGVHQDYHDYYYYYDDDDDYVEDKIISNTIVLLQSLDWPLEGISLLRLGDIGTSFSQLYYAMVEADAVKVKNCLDNNNYSPLALMKTLTKAVTIDNSKSVVIMKLLIDNGAPLFDQEFEKAVSDILDEVFLRNEVDKALVLMQSGIKYKLRFTYFSVKQIFCVYPHGMGNTCLDVFVKPIKPTKEFEIRSNSVFLNFPFKTYIREDIALILIRYLSRIEDYIFPQELKETAAYSVFMNYREESAKMKDTVVCDNLSVFDIIDKPLANIVPYTKNKELMDKLEASKVVRSFPGFSDVILKKLELACQIRDWIEQSKDILAECLPKIISSNHLILSTIVSYLGVPNLIVMSL